MKKFLEYTAKTYADGTATSYVYDTAVNRLASMTDAKSQTTTYAYWPDNTVKQVSYSNANTATVNFTYDSYYPRLLSYADTVTGTTTLAYVPAGTNGAGQVQSRTGPLATLTYGYDALGRLNSRNIDSANASSYGYDALGRMTTETNLLTPSGQFNYAYLGLTSRVASITNPNGQSSVYTYQDSTAPNEPRLAEISNLNASSGVISKFDYQYDPMGRITQWSQQADSASPTTWSYGYDPASELTSAVQKDSSGNTLNVDSYGYDSAGNRISAQTNGTVVSQTPNSVNELGATSVGGSLLWQGHANKPLYSVTVNSKPTTISNSTNFVGTVPVTSGTNTVSVVAEDTKANVSTNNFQTVVAGTGASAPTYDADGNLTTDAQGNTYQWDARNQLLAIVYNAGSNSGNHTEFTYNAIGQRLKIVERSGATVGSGTITSTKQFVWDQTQIAEERDASNTVTKRFYAQGEQIGGASYYYTRDHLGSIREMVDGSGTIQARYSYDPYGNVTKVSGSLDSDFQYAGYYIHSPSGLNLTKYRAYDPITATWISRDILPSVEFSEGANLYTYCGNNFINLMDLLGLCPNPPFTIEEKREIYRMMKAYAVNDGAEAFFLSIVAGVEYGTGVFTELAPAAEVAAKTDNLSPMSEAFMVNSEAVPGTIEAAGESMKDNAREIESDATKRMQQSYDEDNAARELGFEIYNDAINSESNGDEQGYKDDRTPALRNPL